MALDGEHRLLLNHRGRTWGPYCVCGQWFGIPARRRRDAEAQYRDHRDMVVRLMLKRPRAQPQPVTAAEDLPPILRDD